MSLEQNVTHVLGCTVIGHSWSYHLNALPLELLGQARLYRLSCDYRFAHSQPVSQRLARLSAIDYRPSEIGFRLSDFGNRFSDVGFRFSVIPGAII